MAEIPSICQRWITVYSTSWCGQSRRAKALLTSHGLLFEDIDIDRDPSAARQVENWNQGYRSVPTLDIRMILIQPTLADLQSILLVPGVQIADLTIYTDAQSPLSPHVASWFADYEIDYVKIQVEKDAEAAHQVCAWNKGTLALPALDVRFHLTEPVSEELERALGLTQ